MSADEIITELPRLTRPELLEVQAMLDTLIGNEWLDDELSAEDKRRLDEGLAEYRNHRDKARPWEDVEAELRTHTA